MITRATLIAACAALLVITACPGPVKNQEGQVVDDAVVFSKEGDAHCPFCNEPVAAIISETIEVSSGKPAETTYPMAPGTLKIIPAEAEHKWKDVATEPLAGPERAPTAKFEYKQMDENTFVAVLPPEVQAVQVQYLSPSLFPIRCVSCNNEIRWASQMVPCWNCEGAVTCPDCDGVGENLDIEKGGNPITCYGCAGTGRCPICIYPTRQDGSNPYEVGKDGSLTHGPDDPSSQSGFIIYGGITPDQPGIVLDDLGTQ